MKLDARRVPAFLRDPGAFRAVLLHGLDLGLIRERANQATRAVAGALDDPFRVVELARDQVGDLVAEAASISLTGGRRVIRLREATDSAAAAMQAFLAGLAPGFVVLEAPTLPPRSKLRALLEAAQDGAAIACHPEDDRALAASIQGQLAAAGVDVDGDALDWLVGRLGADRGVTVQEVERLALFAGPGGRIDLEAAMEGVGDLAGLSLEDAWSAAAAGDAAAADRALSVAMAEGGTAVGVIRAGILHLQRLHRCALQVAAGMSPSEAVRSARPPVFFRAQPAFARALQALSEAQIRTALERLFDAELACKRTGAPADLICRQLTGQVARLAGRRARGAP